MIKNSHITHLFHKGLSMTNTKAPPKNTDVMRAEQK
jgi:hypothetical protein